MTLTIPFDNSYARLPDAFYTRQSPVPVKEPQLIAFNEGLARILRISPGDVTEMAQAFAGNTVSQTRCMRWAFRPRALWRLSKRVKPFTAKDRCPGRF
jgi:uncharacterized protein YdiU (UPF0061 family)